MTESFLHARLVSSLEKGIIDKMPEDYPALEKISVLRGEHLHFQLFLRPERTENYKSYAYNVALEGIDAAAYEVLQVYADFPCYNCDDSRERGLFVESATGMYPDVLEPLENGRDVRPREEHLTAVWFDAVMENAGVYEVRVTARRGETPAAELALTVTVVDAELGEQSLICTQWFHCDCLASYYNVPVFSEEHWRIMENFMRCAVRYGINCILTPVFTPPLDTNVGTERPTVQLVGVTKHGGTYLFDFSLLKRYLDMAKRCGVRYFEISHLFTQWGAKFAPKVVAMVDGIERRLFGWHTPGTEGEYPYFLSKLLPQLVSFLREEGVLERCRFHVSDEPNENCIEGYRRAKQIVEPYLKGCTIIDALSDVRFFREGIIDTPIPHIGEEVMEFLKEDIKERWMYYCCGGWHKVSNRFLAYPAFRNRILGVQLYKYGFDGFLQWGYDYYYTMGSTRLINPYLCQSGGGNVQSGDTFSVYPGPMGLPLAAPRLAVFHEAVQDIDAFKRCEAVIGRERVVALIDELAGAPVTITEYPKSAEYLLSLRERVNAIIAGAETDAL